MVGYIIWREGVDSGHDICRRPAVMRLFATADAAEGVQSFIERREARFEGR
jgi:hypothetical protein